MSNHLRDATKMISKTPRTDRQHILNFGPNLNLYVKIGFARQLERQLAGANKRIKLLAHELESAGVQCGIAVVNEGIATNENTRLRDRIAHLESWINSLDEVLRYNGKDGQREWCGSEVGYLYQGQRVYVGGDKP